MPFVGVSKTFCTGLSSSSINLYNFSSIVLTSVPLGDKSPSWLAVFSPVYLSGRFDKERFCLVHFPSNIWIVLEYRRVLWLVYAVFLFGERSIQISPSSNLSFHILRRFPNNMLIVLLTVIFMSCAIVIHFCRSIFMTLTAMTSLTEVAAVTFEK